MATPVMMPNVGITVETCVLTAWCVKEGEHVNEGDILFTYETDKSSLEQEAPCSGTLLGTFFGEDADVPVMTNVCVIGEEGEDFMQFAPVSEKKAAKAADAEKQAPAAAAEEKEAENPVVNTGFIKASPRAKNLAAKSGVDLRFTVPSGPDGRIIERDVYEAINEGRYSTEAASSSYNGTEGTGLGGRYCVDDIARSEGGYTDEKLPLIRRTIARQMLSSLQTAAQLTHTLSFDATDILAFRKGIKDGTITKYSDITLNDIILYTVSRILLNPDYKALNAHLICGDTMRYFDDVHMGIAADTDRGLLVPTLRECSRKSLSQISAESKALVSKCRSGKAMPDDLKGGTFTVTNLGVYGIEHFTPIINTPQTAILGVNAVTTKIKLCEGGFRAYQAMGLSLTYDHRAVDGGPASRFLLDVAKALEGFTGFLAEQEEK